MARRVLSILFKLTLVIGCLVGIVLNIRQTRSFVLSFSYYTLQSNGVSLLLFIVLIALEIRAIAGARRAATSTASAAAGASAASAKLAAGPAARAERHPGLHRFKGACTLYILITFLVYHFVLAPTLGTTAPGYRASPADLLVHYFTPLMVFLDYLLFDPKGRFRTRDPLLWALLPLSYLGYVFVYTSLGGRFGSRARPTRSPYFFLDIDRLGIGGVFQWILIVITVYLVLAFALLLLDRLLARLKAGGRPRGSG